MLDNLLQLIKCFRFWIFVVLIEAWSVITQDYGILTEDDIAFIILNLINFLNFGNCKLIFCYKPGKPLLKTLTSLLTICSLVKLPRVKM